MACTSIKNCIRMPDCVRAAVNEDMRAAMARRLEDPQKFELDLHDLIERRFGPQSKH